jgi:hypothetical protein
MFTGFHNHIHGATLLIVPMLAAIRRDRKPDLLQDLVLLAIFLPTYVIVFSGSLTYSAWSLMGVMAWLYGVSFAESCRDRDGDRIHNPQVTWRYRKQSGSCAEG